MYTDTKKTAVAEAILSDIKEIRHDLEALALAYRSDEDTWQGDAAYEEQCYVTADRNDLLSILDKLEAEAESQANEG